MYPKNAASPQRIAIGPVVQISDGAVQTASVLIKVQPQGGAASAGGGTTDYTEGIVHYIPTQAETNYASFMVIAYKTGCIPAAVTIVTSASGVAGHAGLDWSVINSPTSTQTLTNTTVGTVTTTTTATNVTTVNGLAAGVVTAASIAASALNGKGDWNVGKTGYTLTATTGLGNQTANITGNLSGSVGSVTGAVGSVTGNVGGNVVGSVGSVTGSVGSVSAGGIAAGVLTAGAQNEIADAFLDRNMATGTDSGNLVGTIRTVRQALRVLRNRVNLSVSPFEVYKETDVDVSWTGILTTAAGDPINQVEPTGP
jgi:hypothetical protein